MLFVKDGFGWFDSNGFDIGKGLPPVPADYPLSVALHTTDDETFDILGSGIAAVEELLDDAESEAQADRRYAEWKNPTVSDDPDDECEHGLSLQLCAGPMHYPQGM